MESIYYVLSYVCHRRCKHCYEDRFRPYHGAALSEQLAQATADMPRIVDHLPAHMTYLDREAPERGQGGTLPRRRGRIILAGGEALLDPIRTRVTYPAIARIVEKYRGRGGVNVVVQTTGDLVTDAIASELVRLGVWMISVAGLDDYHVGLEGDAPKARLREHLTELFLRHGLRPSEHVPGTPHDPEADSDAGGPVFSFFGATPDSWIGKLWPRGRAWQNGLSRATLADNFCARWSGGLHFLRHEYSGSEVSIDPTGDVFPCCLKTRRPLGSLRDEPLIEILDSLVGDPVFEALSAGEPQRMAETLGWSVEEFLARTRTTTPGGLPYQNLCIGCDRVHEELLGPYLENKRAERQARRRTTA